MIDTHAHLHSKEYNNDLNDVINRALDQGVEKIVLIGTDIITSKRALELTREYDIFYCSLGLFPTESSSDTSFIEQMINEPKVIGIGECGIDLHYDTPLECQISKFISQIELSIKYNKPIIIHSRDAFNETYEILKKYKGKLKGVVHCYSYGIDELKLILDLGLYIGIDGPITYSNASKLREVVKNCPLNQMVVETDCPYLTPVPFRGKRNEPAYLKYILEEISNTLNIDFVEVCDIIKKNSINLFFKE
jgi:TatD DNase family protein